VANISTQKNIGAYVAAVTSVAPQDASAGTITGTAIDRAAHEMPLSLVMHQVAGADSGSPTSLSVTSTLQHSPDNSTWTAYQPDGVNNAATPALTAASTENGLSVDLAQAYRYIRVSTVVAFSGGTSPAINVCAYLVLGGEPTLPAI
jgi:hypothetical protein